MDSLLKQPVASAFHVSAMAVTAKVICEEVAVIQTAFKAYILRVLKQIHLEIGFSKRLMSIMNVFCYGRSDGIDKVAQEPSRLTKTDKKAALSAHEVQSTVRIVLPDEFVKHKITAGAKATQSFKQTLRETHTRPWAGPPDRPATAASWGVVPI